MKKIAYSLFLLIVIGCTAGTDNLKLYESHYKMGLAYLNTEEDYKAIREFEKALEYKPNDPKTHYAIATFYLKKNQLYKAKLYLEKAIKLDPKNSDYHNAYASTAASLGEIETAIKHWKIVLDDPGYSDPEIVYHNMGYALYREDNYQDALKYFNKSIEINRRFMSSYMYIYRIYQSQGKHEEAAEILQRALKANPVFLPIKLELGKYYFDNGNYAKAATEFEEITEIDPKSTEADLAITYLKKMGIHYE